MMRDRKPVTLPALNPVVGAQAEEDGGIVYVRSKSRYDGWNAWHPLVMSEAEKLRDELTAAIRKAKASKRKARK